MWNCSFSSRGGSRQCQSLNHPFTSSCQALAPKQAPAVSCPCSRCPCHIKQEQALLPFPNSIAWENEPGGRKQESGILGRVWVVEAKRIEVLWAVLGAEKPPVMGSPALCSGAHPGHGWHIYPVHPINTPALAQLSPFSAHSLSS